MQKALRSLETGADGLDEKVVTDAENLKKELRHQLLVPGPERIWYVADAFRAGWTMEEIFEMCLIDRWFLVQIEDLVRAECETAAGGLEDLNALKLKILKQKGFSDRRLARLTGTDEHAVRAHRHSLGVRPVFKRVDTCAAEFPTNTAYMYSTYEEECESNPSGKKKIMVLGGGPCLLYTSDAADDTLV